MSAKQQAWSIRAARLNAEQAARVARSNVVTPSRWVGRSDFDDDYTYYWLRAVGEQRAKRVAKIEDGREVTA
jgi:hypothetical protein